MMSSEHEQWRLQEAFVRKLEYSDFGNKWLDVWFKKFSLYLLSNYIWKVTRILSNLEYLIKTS